MNNVILAGNFLRKIYALNVKIMRMTHLTKHRGIDDEGYLFHYNETCHYSAVIDLHKDTKTYTYHFNNRVYIICFDGELFNSSSLKEELIELNYTFVSQCDSEVALYSYIEWGISFLNKLDGVFALVIDDGYKMLVARDAMGIKPLYYYKDEDTLVIADEIKCILAYIGESIVDEEGIKELLGLGPSVTPGKTIYKDIYSLRPAHYMQYQGDINIHRYWSLINEEHTDTLDETITKVRNLVNENTLSQIKNNEVTAMLSGGLDSTILTSISASFKEQLDTYSVSYEDQKEYFSPYDYQTTMDDEYIEDAITLYNCNHHYIELSQNDLVNGLKEALILRDMPGMADIDVSLLLFSKEIAKTHKTCLSGECADEIFGGYPWFYKEELYNLPHFPWMREIESRVELFHDDIKKLNIKDYIIQRYNETLAEIDTKDKHKQIIYLNIEWFMQTLLSRCYTMTSSRLKVLVPFASPKIVQYLYNMPINYIMYNNEEKGILRKAFENDLPISILHRKKNPYPKTQSPKYKELISHLLLESLNDENNILLKFFNKDKLYELATLKGDLMTNPWFGQLMMGAQFLAYLYSIYLWGKIYHIKIQI